MVNAVIRARFRSRHAKLLLSGVFATFVAASAMAFGSGGMQHPHQDEAPNAGLPHAGQGGGSGGGDTTLETQQNSAPDGGSVQLADNGAPGGGNILGGGPPATPGGSYGPGDNNDNDSGNGFMPNGEDGLIVLADFA